MVLRRLLLVGASVLRSMDMTLRAHAGGYGTAGAPIVQSEIYTPNIFAGTFSAQAATWLSQNPLSQARAEFSMIVVPDGRAVAVGGYTTGATPVTSAEVFSTTTNFWQPAGTMAHPRADFQAVAVF